MGTFLDEEGILHEFLAMYTAQKNGFVERKNRTLIEMARMMLYNTTSVAGKQTKYRVCNRASVVKMRTARQSADNLK